MARPFLTFLTLNFGRSLSLPACFMLELDTALDTLPVLALRRRLNLGGVTSEGSNLGGFAAALEELMLGVEVLVADVFEAELLRLPTEEAESEEALVAVEVLVSLLLRRVLVLLTVV